MDISEEYSGKHSLNVGDIHHLADELARNMVPQVYITNKEEFNTANFMDIMSPIQNIGAMDFNHRYPWITTALQWIIFWFISRDDMSRFPFTKRDDLSPDAASDAALKSFEQLLKELEHPGEHLCLNRQKATDSLCARILSYFDSFCESPGLENNSHVNMKAIIKEAANLAEDVVSARLGQIELQNDGLLNDHSWMRSWLKYCVFGNCSDIEGPRRILLASLTHDAAKELNADLVGLGCDVKKIKERLLRNTSRLEIIPITGMGGIGKTTLATRVYEDPEIIHHFCVRGSVQLSKEYATKGVLLGLLQSIGTSGKEIFMESKDIVERLYKRLKGWRYLILLDDVWDTKAWDDIKSCFPNDNNGSRILLISRLAEVAVYASPHSPLHSMKFLNAEDSWNLLSRRVFMKKTCPPQLVNVGKQIAESCQGLPLAIVVVAGQLSEISKTRDCWENIAKDIVSILDGTQEQFYNILSLSYNELPHQLRACFLYMGAFPRNSEISVEKLYRLWTAVGFLCSDYPNNLKEIAQKCLENLISRSLIIVRKRKFDGSVKTCGIHDLLWDLIHREAQKEGVNVFGHSTFSHFSNGTREGMKNIMGLTHTFLYVDQSFELHFPLNHRRFKLLRILDILLLVLNDFPHEVTELVNLRYLALSTYSNIPGSVSKLSNLETLICDHRGESPVLPKEIWLLPHLRHLHVGSCAFLPPPFSAKVEENCVSVLSDFHDGSSVSVFSDLQTISTISLTSCTMLVLEKISNLKQLGIHEIHGDYSNAVCFCQLENLKLCCKLPRYISQWNSFVPNIKQLTLLETNLEWMEMNSIAKLPYLEVLKLKRHSFQGNVWEQVCEGFPQLKFLLLQSLDLVHWRANKDHFPILQCLVIRDCAYLCEIPDDFGELHTLHLIRLDYCNQFAALSARKIKMQQRDFGNDELSVCIDRMLPEQQFICLAVAFVYMTLWLKKQPAVQDHRKVRMELEAVRRQRGANEKKSRSVLSRILRSFWS